MLLPQETFIHHVHLRTANLDRAVSFYRSIIGLKEISRTGTKSLLSADGTAPAQLILSKAADAEPRNPFAPGLFHVAWKVPNRRSLATMIRHLGDNRALLQGFADHGVSEAVYLADPEGNGIEIYRDRPREEWPLKNGRVEMVTEPLDVESLFEDLKNRDENRGTLDERTIIGHIHLQVSDLERARKFYHQALGFDVTQDSFPGALFVAAGGYHHHIGLNIWNSRGSIPSPKITSGLASFGIAVPDAATVNQLRTHLEHNDYEITSTQDSSFQVHDPDHLRVEVLPQSHASLPKPTHS